MSDTPVAVTPKPAPIQPAAASHWALFLGLGLVFMLGCRVLLFVWMPERSSDFDNLYAAAAHLLRGENP
jgi:hypothetical protein